MNKEHLDYVKNKLTFYDKLTHNQQQKLISNTTIMKFKAGENIYNTSKECVGILFILSGELRVYIMSEEGKEITLYRLLDDETCILSASCTLNNITFDVNIDAQKDTTVIAIKPCAFKEIMEQNIYAENYCLKLTADRFSEVMWALEQILFLSFDRRLAIFLLDEVNKNQKATLNITHDQIAKYIGSAREVVSRMLKYFTNEGIILQSRGTLEILNVNKLKNIANGKKY